MKKNILNSLLIALFLLSSCTDINKGRTSDSLSTSETPEETSSMRNNAVSFSYEEHNIRRDGMNIYGRLYIPENNDVHPLVIL